MRRRAGPAFALLLLAAAAGCARAQLGPGGTSCGPREVALVNASAAPVEQIYLGTGAPSGWGTDLLRPRGADLPSGAALPLRLPGAGPHAIRAVWADGRAAELGGVDGCATTRITLTDTTLRAE
jgi:hypothetical protein